MTNNFHDLTTRNLFISLCSHMAYMQGQLEALHQLDDPDGHYWYRESVALRQKAADHLAALADEPAVPQGREPASVTGQPAAGEVAELVETLKGIAYWRRHGKPGEPAPTSFDIRQADRLDRAAELLQRLSPPQPLANGEVGKPVAWMCPAEPYLDGNKWHDQWQVTLDQRLAEYWARPGKPTPLFTRAAELLERLSPPQPVPVSERLPGDQLCWWFEADEDCGYGSTWTLLRIRGSSTDRTHWLPAHALPLPEVGE